MSRIITVKSRGKKVRSISPNCSIFSMRGRSNAKRSLVNCRGSFALNLKSLAITLVVMFFGLGFFYLYQVNDLATKGYEMGKIEKEISELSEANKNNRIKEVELKSLYNIEKTAETSNLVSARGITYLNLNGPVAMK